MLFKKKIKGRIVSIGKIKEINYVGKHDEGLHYMSFEGCYCDDTRFYDELREEYVFYYSYLNLLIEYNLDGNEKTLKIEKLNTREELKENQEIELIYDSVTKKILLPVSCSE